MKVVEWKLETTGKGVIEESEPDKVWVHNTTTDNFHQIHKL
jgi:hypothetical protein